VGALSDADAAGGDPSLEKVPWLDYTGQTTRELLACKESHAIVSLLCALEESIQAKLDT